MVDNGKFMVNTWLVVVNSWLRLMMVRVRATHEGSQAHKDTSLEVVGQSQVTSHANAEYMVNIW